MRLIYDPGKRQSRQPPSDFPERLIAKRNLVVSGRWAEFLARVPPPDNLDTCIEGIRYLPCEAQSGPREAVAATALVRPRVELA